MPSFPSAAELLVGLLLRVTPETTSLTGGLPQVCTTAQQGLETRIIRIHVGGAAKQLQHFGQLVGGERHVSLAKLGGDTCCYPLRSKSM